MMAALQRESGFERVRDMLQQAGNRRLRLHTSFLCLMEVEYLSVRQTGESGAEQVMASVLNWPLEVHESTPEWRNRAAGIKARGGLSLADAWVAALALRLDADLVHKDREFDSVPGLRSIHL
jgi:predicted nucleic acid-binding protein